VTKVTSDKPIHTCMHKHISCFLHSYLYVYFDLKSVNLNAADKKQDVFCI